MPGTTAKATHGQPQRAEDGYRVLFDQLPAGAARCRLIVERDQVVERHHGRVGATSEIGVGSRFELTLGPEHT